MVPIAQAPARTTAETSVLPSTEARALFERQAQRLLNMSGEQFLRKWEAGEFRELPDTPEARRVMRVAYLIPFGRQDP